MGSNRQTVDAGTSGCFQKSSKPRTIDVLHGLSDKERSTESAQIAADNDFKRFPFIAHNLCTSMLYNYTKLPPVPATVFLLKFIQIRSATVRDIYLFNIGNTGVITVSGVADAMGPVVSWSVWRPLPLYRVWDPLPI